MAKQKRQIIHALLSYFLGEPEPIDGHGLHGVYLWRWTVLSSKRFKIYLHHFVKDDWSRDLHDHPKNFISIGLWGSYTEYYMTNPRIMSLAGSWWSDMPHKRTYRAPWFRHFGPNHTHRIVDVKNAWTLVIVGRTSRRWGFWVDGEHVPWDQYVYSQLWRKRAHGKPRLYAYLVTKNEIYSGETWDDALATALDDIGFDPLVIRDTALDDQSVIYRKRHDGLYERVTVLQALHGVSSPGHIGRLYLNEDYQSGVSTQGDTNEKDS